MHTVNIIFLLFAMSILASIFVTGFTWLHIGLLIMLLPGVFVSPNFHSYDD